MTAASDPVFCISGLEIGQKCLKTARIILDVFAPQRNLALYSISDLNQGNPDDRIKRLTLHRIVMANGCKTQKYMLYSCSYNCNYTEASHSLSNLKASKNAEMTALPI